MLVRAHRRGAIRFVGCFALMLACGVGVSCKHARRIAARYPRPDLEAIYGSSGVNGERNPVVVIPGFAGSALVDEDGGLVWGAFFNGDAVGWKDRDGMRAFAVDVDRLPAVPAPDDLVWVPDDAEATTMLERVQAGRGVAEVRFPVYAALVETLERGGYVDGFAEDGEEVDGDPAAPAWFGFGYDWRQDGVGNAQRLHAFLGRCSEIVRERRRRVGQADRPVRFDVVAHSMGGLPARYYLRYGAQDVLDDPLAEVTWAGAAMIDRLIVVGTPNFGTMKALRELVYGRKHAVLTTMQATMIATWPAVYQMLPRGDHPLWVDPAGLGVPGPTLDARTFREHGWGPFEEKQARYLEWLYPDVASADERRERIAHLMDAAFERGRRFHAALDRHPGTRSPAQLLLFAGDADATLARAVVTEQKGRTVLLFEGKEALGLELAGDGTVARYSALADERVADGGAGYLRSPVPWDATVFVSDRHSSFLGNPTFQNNLLHLLLDVPASTRRAPSPEELR